MIKKLLVLLALILTTGSLVAFAAKNTPSPAMAPSAAPQEPTSQIWNLRNADIRSVIAEVSRITGKNFVIDSRVTGKVSVISNKPMNPREVYQVFLSILQVSGFAAIPSGHIIKIVPNSDARSMGVDLNRRIISGNEDEIVVRVVPVKYVPAIQLVPSLRPLMPQWSNISAYEPSNMVIISGPASSVQQVSDIIEQVDSSSNSGIDVVPLRHALAMDIIETLKTLVAGPNRGGGGMMQQAPSIAADDRSNSILISGDKATRIKIRLLITKLDTKSPSGTSGRTQIIYLRFLRAQDILPVLAGIAQANFSGTVGTTVGTVTTPVLDTSSPITDAGMSTTPTGSSSANSSSSYGSSNAPRPSSASGATPLTNASSASVEGNVKPKVQIIAEPNTNSIIITAPPTLMRTLKSIIRQLDVRPSQILIEAIIADIDADALSTLGIIWGSNVPITSSGTTTTSFTPGFAVINSQISLKNFQGNLTALATNQKATILSTPSIAVLDNHQAKILVGKQVSIQSSSYPGNSNGSGTTNPYNTFDRLNVALHLYVRPQITEGNTVTMQIDHGDDTLENPASNSTTPVVNTSSIVTSVIVNSGDILVLGGLVQNGLNYGETKIPILGDIPGIGNFFLNHSREKTKKVLMVFIRPIILQNEKAGISVSNTKYYETRNEQLQFAQEEHYHQGDREALYKNLNAVQLPVPFTSPAPQLPPPQLPPPQLPPPQLPPPQLPPPQLPPPRMIISK